jgi:hypothetical protein
MITFVSWPPIVSDLHVNAKRALHATSHALARRAGLVDLRLESRRAVSVIVAQKRELLLPVCFEFIVERKPGGRRSWTYPGSAASERDRAWDMLC